MYLHRICYISHPSPLSRSLFEAEPLIDADSGFLFGAKPLITEPLIRASSRHLFEAKPPITEPPLIEPLILADSRSLLKVDPLIPLILAVPDSTSSRENGRLTSTRFLPLKVGDRWSAVGFLSSTWMLPLSTLAFLVIQTLITVSSVPPEGDFPSASLLVFVVKPDSAMLWSCSWICPLFLVGPILLANVSDQRLECFDTLDDLWLAGRDSETCDMPRLFDTDWTTLANILAMRGRTQMTEAQITATNISISDQITVSMLSPIYVWALKFWRDSTTYK